MTAPRPTVSVVVPVKDSIRTIEACLRSIRAQTWEPLELIVIDNFSTDGTWEVAQRFAHHAEQAGPERSAQRNLGVERASGPWILWIDADMELPPTIVERAMAAAVDEEADGVFVPEVTVGDGYWTACRALERSCCIEEVLMQSPRLLRATTCAAPAGSSSPCRAPRMPSCASRMIGDGCRLAWIPDLIVHDEGRMSLGFIVSKRYYYGRGLKRYKAEHPGALSAQAGSAVGAYRRHWRRLAAKPAVAAGVVFMRAGEFGAYGVGAALGALERPDRSS